MELRSGERRRPVTSLDRDGANDNDVDERGEPSPQSRPAATVGTHEDGDRGGRSSSSLIEREIELVREKERLVRLELELERVRAENRPRTSGGGAELNLREEVLSFSRLMKGVLTQMPSSELLVPSWFDGVENVFATYEVPERLRGSLVRPYFTERMRALVNRLSAKRVITVRLRSEFSWNSNCRRLSTGGFFSKPLAWRKNPGLSLRHGLRAALSIMLEVARSTLLRTC